MRTDAWHDEGCKELEGYPRGQENGDVQELQQHGQHDVALGEVPIV